MPAAMGTPPTLKIAQVDVAALIPKDPGAPPASQQTYRQVVGKESRCRPATRAGQIDVDATIVVPGRGRIVFENPHWTLRRVILHIIGGRHGTSGSPTTFANPPMAQRCISYSQPSRAGQQSDASELPKRES